MSDHGSGQPSFTHLHVHSHFTFLGATASVDDLVSRARDDGLKHLALTDTNVLTGAVAFSKACQAAGIQPLVGMAVTVAPLGELRPQDGLGPGLLVLLATGPAGYRSLCRLSSIIQGSPDRLTHAARGLDWEQLERHREGLVCLSGGRRGWIERCLRAGDRAASLRYGARLAGIFGEAGYLAMELHQPEDSRIAQEVSGIARHLGMATVAVQPIYSLSPAERPRLHLLAAIAGNRRLADVPRAELPDSGEPGVDLHWLAPKEVRRRFADFPEALRAIGQVTARCDPSLPDGRPIWPSLQLPAGETADSTLARQAQIGLEERYGSEPEPDRRQRLQRELAAITSHGYAPLFLLVADIVRFARSREIPVSTRGSVANSLVAYCTGITTVDPLEHNLLFERFLSPARLDPPDIDLDFCSRRRDQVLDYVRRTYGEDRVALVATVSTMRLKGAVREVAKAHGLSQEAIDRLARQVPGSWHPDPRRRRRSNIDQFLAGLEALSERQVVQEAASLVGQPDHLSVHPGGIVITPCPLTDLVPVQWTAKGFLITQFDYGHLEALGLPKVDLLGIRALTVLADAVELIRRLHQPYLRLAEIPMDDAGTGDMLEQGRTIGVFQCESAGAQRTLRQLGARTLRDLAVANAFFKPGPATGGMAATFIRRYRGEEPVSFLHPSLEPILAPTKGVLIFQEQVLRLATEIAGLSWEQADHLRRGMSKFQPQEMEAMHAAFVKGCTRGTDLGHPPEPGIATGPKLTVSQAERLWEQVMAFAGYGFNQGHATAYADVSYRSAYLKAHWPAEFLCARLADWGGFHHQAIYIAEAISLGIEIRPPHVNHSNRKFTLTWQGAGALTPEHADPAQGATESGPSTEPDVFAPARASQSPVLWMGLGQIRDLRRASVKAIVQARRQRPFQDLRDLLQRADLRPKEVAHLIQCGALDGLGASRTALLAESRTVERAGSSSQLAFEFAGPSADGPESPDERLQWEHRILGLPISVNPLQAVGVDLAGGGPLRQAIGQPGQAVTVAAFRLPGWTGGRGIFVGDGEDYAVAILERGQGSPEAWQPLLLQGRWLSDEWATSWLQVQSWRALQ